MRRDFLKTILALPALTALPSVGALFPASAQEKVQRTGGPRLKTSLNAYSFNGPLLKGTMTLDELLEYCAEQGFDGVDVTGYYFRGYPEVPTDEYIFRIKKKAFLLGLEISGTGVRNDFSYVDADKRTADITLVKKWIDVAAKLGAPVIRIFAGTQDTTGHSWEDVAAWMVKDIKACVAYGEQRGVMVAIQNHNDFIKTAEHALTILKMVDSPWFGLILDIGSFRADDPYKEIEIASPYAVNWQIKESIFIKGEPVKTDLQRIVKIVRNAGYRGYLPIETLGAGEPREKVKVLLAELQTALR
jgi:sugar phosphate isomerase/epimerase